MLWRCFGDVLEMFWGGVLPRFCLGFGEILPGPDLNGSLDAGPEPKSNNDLKLPKYIIASFIPINLITSIIASIIASYIVASIIAIHITVSFIASNMISIDTGSIQYR